MEERYIKAINPDKWVRPAGWLQMPTITSSQNRLAFLFAVYADEENCFSINYASATCNYTIDWGDGTSLNVINSNTTREKRYDYASISSIVLQDDFGINYKQVIVTVTLNSGTSAAWSISSAAATTRPGKSQILESVLSHNNGVSFQSRPHIFMQSLKIVKLVMTGVVSNFFVNMVNLRNLEGFENIDTTAATTATSTFSNIGPVCQALNFTWNSGAAGMSSILAGTRIKKFGNVTLLGSGGLTSAMSSQNIEEIGNINLGNHNSLATMFQNCFCLEKIGTITTGGSAVNLLSTFNNCYSLQEIVFTNAANITIIPSTAFNSCISLRRLVLPGILLSVTVPVACMQRTALVELFTSLGTPATTQTLTITGNPGIPDLTAADLLIATSKNWTVVQ
jgi:hypothetical protein